MSEKNFEPTPRRRKEVQEQGKFPRSRLWVSSSVALGGLGGMAVTLPSAIPALLSWTEKILLGGSVSTSEALQGSFRVMGRLTLLPTVGALFGGLLASLLSVGFHFRAAHLTPKWDRVDPFAGWQRLWTLKPLKEALKGVATFLAMALLAVLLGKGLFHGGIQGIRRSGAESFLLLLREFESVALKWAWLFLGIGVLDFAWARWRHARELRMNREEVRRDHREAEGDPQYKAHRFAFHRAILEGGSARGVASASAVVVNPTHIAVALRYASTECDAPYVVAKGQEDDARLIREEALARGIPIVRDVPLARTLLPLDVGEQIPEELYRAAAVILQIAMESQRGEAGQRSGA